MNVIGPTITADQYIYVTNVSGVTITINAAATVANLDVLTFLTQQWPARYYLWF